MKRLFYSAFVWKCTDMCKHRFGVQLLQNPPLCRSSVVRSFHGRLYHTLVQCKKRLAVFPPQPGCHLPNSPWPEIFKLFRARESLVSDILAGDGKTTKLFLQCVDHSWVVLLVGAAVCSPAGPGYPPAGSSSKTVII